MERVGTALAYAPVAVAVLALVAVLLRWYRRTLGRRGDRYERLSRLGTNANLTFFTSVLGDPPAIRRTVTSTVHVLVEGSDDFVEREKDFEECIYIDRDFYVQALADSDETVVAFSVTTRSKRFHPKLRSPGYTVLERGWLARRLRLHERLMPIFKVKLGKTHFAELDQPQQAAASLGARTFHYYEVHSLGNPGHYQEYVFAINDAGFIADEAPHTGTIINVETGPWEFAWGGESGTAGLRAGARLR
jgi:hypothetical protein